MAAIEKAEAEVAAVADSYAIQLAATGDVAGLRIEDLHSRAGLPADLRLAAAESSAIHSTMQVAAGGVGGGGCGEPCQPAKRSKSNI